MPDTPKVLQVSQLATLDAAGKVQQSYVVRYMVGDHGPFTLNIPVDQFSAARVAEEMQKFAAEIAALNRAG